MGKTFIAFKKTLSILYGMFLYKIFRVRPIISPLKGFPCEVLDSKFLVPLGDNKAIKKYKHLRKRSVVNVIKSCCDKYSRYLLLSQELSTII